MTDAEIENAIAQGLRAPGNEGLAELLALRDRVQAAAGVAAPTLPQIWRAIMQVLGRSPDDEVSMQHEEEHARWLSATRGAADPETLEAWLDLGDAAEQEMVWDVATRAWQAAIAATESSAEIDAARPSLSPALRGLGSRRMVASRFEEARALFERDVVLNEQLYPHGHAQLAISLDNLARALDRLGDGAGALRLRERQREVLVATGASAGQVSALDAQIHQLKAS
jgi:tetratricopeptide (TPR) repeat protein